MKGIGKPFVRVTTTIWVSPGNTITVGAKRLRLRDGLLQPRFSGEEDVRQCRVARGTIMSSLFRSDMDCDVYICQNVYADMVLSNGANMFMTKELTALAPSSSSYFHLVVMHVGERTSALYLAQAKLLCLIREQLSRNVPADARIRLRRPCV